MAADNLLKDAFEDLGQFVIIGGKYLIIAAGVGIAVFVVTTVGQGVVNFVAGLFPL